MIINFIKITHEHTIIGATFFGHPCDLNTATTWSHHGGAAFDIKDMGAPTVSCTFKVVLHWWQSVPRCPWRQTQSRHGAVLRRGDDAKFPPRNCFYTDKRTQNYASNLNHSIYSVMTILNTGVASLSLRLCLCRKHPEKPQKHKKWRETQMGFVPSNKKHNQLSAMEAPRKITKAQKMVGNSNGIRSKQ